MCEAEFWKHFHSGVKQSVDQESVDSYHVRGVEGSCAEHLIIEFYMAVVLLAFILIIISFFFYTPGSIDPRG